MDYGTTMLPKRQNISGQLRPVGATIVFLDLVPPHIPVQDHLEYPASQECTCKLNFNLVHSMEHRCNQIAHKFHN